MPNVTLMGTASSGGSARSISSRVPVVDLRIKLASMASFQPNGKLYDGNGVVPDIQIEPNPDYLVGKADNVLKRAVEKVLQK